MHASIYRYCKRPIFASKVPQVPASKMSKGVQWLNDAALELFDTRYYAALLIIKMFHDNHGKKNEPFTWWALDMKPEQRIK
jgi:hypothetical protein